MVKPALASAARLIAAACLAAACAAAPSDPTAEATSAAASVASPTETVFIAESTPAATPIADLKILSPGPDSQITSPISLKAQFNPGTGGKVRITLVDSAGRLLARQIIVVGEEAQADFEIKIDFEISRPKLAARLTLSTEDEFKRMLELDSVDLILLAQGEVEITTAVPNAPIRIDSPAASDPIKGGALTISGVAKIEPGRPLDVRLITREGRVLAFADVYPNRDDGTFEVTLDYEVDEPTSAQIAITENSGLMGPAHFTGIEVLLSP